MPSFDADAEQINVFELADFYVFKHYFELDEAFDLLRDFYNRDEYRFEVPKDRLEEVEATVADYYYELTVVDDLEPFTVVMRKYSDHPTFLFRNAVIQESRGDYNLFVMKDKLSVEQAVIQGAERVEAVDAVSSL